MTNKQKEKLIRKRLKELNNIAWNYYIKQLAEESGDDFYPVDYLSDKDGSEFIRLSKELNLL